MSSAHNISGQAYSLTVMTPIVNGQEAQLARYLDGLQSGDQSPLAGVRGTHFARWVVIDDVIYEGPDQGEREHLKYARLLFTSNFDGELDPYLEALRTGLGDSVDTIWGNCIGYPGSGDPGAFAYLRVRQRWVLHEQQQEITLPGWQFSQPGEQCLMPLSSHQLPRRFGLLGRSGKP